MFLHGFSTVGECFRQWCIQMGMHLGGKKLFQFSYPFFSFANETVHHCNIKDDKLVELIHLDRCVDYIVTPCLLIFMSLKWWWS